MYFGDLSRPYFVAKLTSSYGNGSVGAWGVLESYGALPGVVYLTGRHRDIMQCGGTVRFRRSRLHSGEGIIAGAATKHPLPARTPVIRTPVYVRSPRKLVLLIF